MYPGRGAPYRFDLPEAREGIARIRKLLDEPVIEKHPEGGKASIKGYDEGVWLAFGHIAQGLRAHIFLTSDEVVKSALDGLMWAICGFEVIIDDKGGVGLLNFHKLKDALDNLESAVTGVPTRWTLKFPGNAGQA